MLPPLLWIGVVYVGSLFALLLQSFYSLDDYSGLIVREFTLSTYAQLLETANLQIIILRTVMMAALVTLALLGHRLSHRLLRGALCAAAGPRRCSISR